MFAASLTDSQTLRWYMGEPEGQRNRAAEGQRGRDARVEGLWTSVPLAFCASDPLASKHLHQRHGDFAAETHVNVGAGHSAAGVVIAIVSQQLSIGAVADWQGRRINGAEDEVGVGGPGRKVRQVHVPECPWGPRARDQ